MLEITEHSSLRAFPKGFCITWTQTGLLFLRYGANQNHMLSPEPPPAAQIQNSLPAITPNYVTYRLFKQAQYICKYVINTVPSLSNA